MSNKKRNIEFSKPEEPAFLKRLKGQIGLKQDFTTIETKNEDLKKEDLSYRDEEPAYVIGENSDITEKELNYFKEKVFQEKEFKKDNEITEQRMIFKKPKKMIIEDKTNCLHQGSKKTISKKIETLNTKNIEKKKEIKIIKNGSLLSFNEEDEES